MSIKKQIKKTFSKEGEMLELRRFSSKVVFVVASMIFFTCYYFLALDFSSEIIINIFPYVYVGFISSIMTYIYYMLAIRVEHKGFRISIGIFLFLLFLLLLTIFFTDLYQIEDFWGSILGNISNLWNNSLDTVSNLWTTNLDKIKELLNI